MKNRILLLAKIACAAGIVLLMEASAEAAVVNFTAANAQGATVDAGTLATITEPADGAVITSLSYTVSGLTIDANGVNNDTATFTLDIIPVGTGTNTINWDHNSGTREFDFNNGTFSNGEGIFFGTISVSGTSSGGLAYQLDSALYKEFTVRRFASGESFSISGDVTTTTETHPGVSVALNDNFFTAAAVSGGGTWNATNVDFTVNVSAVPEPSSFALLGGALACFATGSRRRRTKASA